METKKNTMELWDSVCKTDPNTTKDAKIGGRKITAIDAQSQRKKATWIFGPYGIGWGVKNETFTQITVGTTELVTYHATLFYSWDNSKGEIPINASIKMAYMTKAGQGYLTIDDEYSKKVATNALTKGLSALGFNSDVFERKFDDCKYVAALKEEFFYINPDQVSEINDLIDVTKSDKAKFLQVMNAKTVGSIPQHAYQKAIAALRAKQRKMS